MTVTHAAVCCCAEEDVFLFFVPCPGTDSCAGNGFFALKSEWTEILGEAPVVNDVWKYNDSSRENPCDYCGKFQTEFSPGTAAPNSGFEKQDDCNDPDCPLPLIFFVPCDEDLCGSYTMAALASEWETFLGLGTGTIDLTDPTTYAGTWLFERTDGTECCEDLNEEPCFKFCGNLSLSGSTDLCFDDATYLPASERCLKCDVPDNKVQRLNASSAVSFTLQDNCEDDNCPVVCRTQGCHGNFLKVSGTKVFSFQSLVEASELDTDFQGAGGFDGTIIGTGKNEIHFGVVVQYETYLEANATTWDGVSSVNAWDQIYSNHCKPDPGCTVVSNVQIFNLVEGGFAHKSTITHIANNEDGNPQDVSTSFTSTTTFSISDQEDTMGGSKLQKRKDVYEDAITKGCNLSNTPGGFVEICPTGTTNDDCVMVWSNNLTTTATNPLIIRTSTDYVETGTFSGTLTDTSQFSLKMATSMIDFNAKDDCCCTDIPEFDGMFWTDANSFVQFSELFGQMHDQGISSSGVLTRFRLASMFSQFRNGEFKGLFDGPGTNNWDLGKFKNPYVDADNKEDYICGDLSLSWTFSFDETVDQDDMVINPLDAIQQASRRLMIEASISDTITNIECVDAPPTGCEDGTIDIP